MNLSNRAKGALCIICAALCFSCMSAFVRLAGDLHTMEKAFFRNFIAAILVYIIIRRERIPLRIEQGKRLFVLLRCVFCTA